MSINRVALSGNLTRSPELRQTAGGMTIMTFGLAVNDRTKNQQTGEWEDRPNFVDCVVFGKRAESLSKFLTKGMKVSLDGKLRYSSWERDGQRRSKLEVIVDDIDVMQRRGDSHPSNARQSNDYADQSQKAPQNGSQAPADTFQEEEYYDAGIPF